MNRYFEMLKQYVISGGQVYRRVSWIFTLCFFNVSCPLGFVEILVGGTGFVVFIGSWGLAVLAVLIPSIVISVSILHDANRSGWWLLISFIPLIGSLILLGFMAQDSQSNENQGGSNPEDATV